MTCKDCYFVFSSIIETAVELSLPAFSEREQVGRDTCQVSELCQQIDVKMISNGKYFVLQTFYNICQERYNLLVIY